MESEATLLVILVVALLLAAPVLAIIALVRVSELRKSFRETPKLIARIYSLEQRLAELERKPPPLTAGTTPTPAPVAHTLDSGAASAKLPEPAGEPRPAPIAATPPVSPSAPAADSDFETMVAGRWLYYIGILALAFAVTFFLKYAFDNNWIGPAGRVGIGLLVGSAMFPVSHWIVRRGYRYFSEGIAGLGAAILYLSIWAGWHDYLLFGQSTAFALMIVVTAATVLVAIGRSSERIALLALIGGSLTPALVSTGHNEEVSLFTYLVILGAGLLAIAWKRDWKSLPPVLFSAILIYFWGWYSQFYADNELSPTIVFASLFFVLFAVLPLIRSTREGELPLSEIVLVIGNAFQYLIALRLMLWPQYRWTLTFGVLAVGALHGITERVLPQKGSQANRMSRILYAGLALTFATLAIPIRLDGHWITLAFAAEGLMLIWGGLRISSLPLRAAGLVLFAMLGTRLVLVPISAAPVFLLNARFLTLACCAAVFLAAFLFAQRSKLDLSETETRVYYVLSIAASFCLLFALSREVWELYGRAPALAIDQGLAQQLALSMLWLFYALALIVGGAKWKSAGLRWQGLVLLGVTVVKVFFFDLSFLTRFYRIVSFFILGLVLLVVSFFYQRSVAASKAGKA